VVGEEKRREAHALSVTELDVRDEQRREEKMSREEVMWSERRSEAKRMRCW
jgi:hypothetical protein